MPRTRSEKAKSSENSRKESLTEESGQMQDASMGNTIDREDERSGDADKGEGGSSNGAEEKRRTMEERMSKMHELRKRMADSSKANRRAVATESNQHKQSARVNAVTARKLERAERTLDEHDAQERGEDYERLRSWGYSIEDNEKWEEKLQQKEAKKDQGYIDPISASERRYRRLVSQMKPDVKSYAEQKQNAAPPSSSSSTLVAPSDSILSVSKLDGASSVRGDLRYGTHEPDDAALDRVVAHLNAEADVRAKRSRYRADDPDAEVNYINDKNKHYNKKIKRYYDKYTTTIRENFERGTAL